MSEQTKSDYCLSFLACTSLLRSPGPDTVGVGGGGRGGGRSGGGGVGGGGGSGRRRTAGGTLAAHTRKIMKQLSLENKTQNPKL